MERKTKDQNKKKTKTTRKPQVFTQNQLKDLYSVDVLRQPRNEILVFRILECLGTRLVRNNTLGGAYEAIHWRGRFLTWNSTRFDPDLTDDGKAGLLEVQPKKWREAIEKMDIDPHELEPELMRGLYTISADSNGHILSILEGDHLDEILYDSAEIIYVE